MMERPAGGRFCCEPLDFLRATPRTNSGACGHPTCLAFAVAVTKGGADPARCPHLAPAILRDSGGEAPGEGLAKVAKGQDARDMALVAHLKTKIHDLDYPAIAPRLGAEFIPGPPAALHFRYLGQSAQKYSLVANSVKSEIIIDPEIQILSNS